MGFNTMIKLLQKKDKGKIILVSLGTFYVAGGKDAVLLHNLLDLKVSCMEAEVCKVGFPLNSLEKYTKLIEEKNFSYIVYNFDSKNAKLELVKEYKGNLENNIEDEKINCYMCRNTMKIYKKPDKYVEAVAKLYKNENTMEEKRNDKTKNKRKGIIVWKKSQKKKTN